MDQASSATVDAPRRWTGVVRLPEEDPGVPDTRSPARLLLWVGRHQIPTLVAGVFFGVLWMVAQALMPFAIGRAIEDGIVEQRQPRARSVGARRCSASASTQAAAGIMRHRYAVFNWLQASFRMAQVVSHHSARSGPAVRGRLSTGEVVATVSNDAMRAGGAFDITARLSGAIVAYVVVAFILLSASVVLGLIVLIGVPVLVLLLGFVIKPLQARQRGSARGGRQADRARRGHRRRAARAARHRRRAGVLRPLSPPLAGGPSRRRSRRASAVDARRRPGLRPGTLRRGRHLARRPVRGFRARSTSASSLRSTATRRSSSSRCEPLRKRWTRSRARSSAPDGCSTCSTVEPHVADPESPADEPPSGVPLVDERSGLVVEPGLVTCIVSSRPDESTAIADRLGRFGTDDGVLLGETSRSRISAERRRAPPDRRQRGRSGSLLRDPAFRARSLGPRGRRGHPPGDLRRECRGRPGGASRGARRRCRRARPVVLGRPAAAARPRARAPCRPRGARARRADERRRRTYRGEDRAPAPRSSCGADDRRSSRRARSCSTRPTTSSSSRTVGSSPRARIASCSPTGRTTARRSRVGRTCERAAPDRRRARAARPGPAARAPGTGGRCSPRIGLHAAAATAGLAGPALLGRLVQSVEDGTTRAYVDKLVLVLAVFLLVQTVLTWFARRASFVLSETDLRRAARGLHAPRARAAALDGRAGGDGRPRLPYDRRRRLACPHDPLRSSRDADRGGDDRSDRGSGVLGQPGRGAALPHGRPGSLDRHALVPQARAGRIPLGARHVRDARRHVSARRSRAGGRSTRSACGRSASTGSTPTSRTRIGPSGARSGCARSGSRRRSSPTCFRWRRRSPGAAGSSRTGNATIGEVTAISLYVVQLADPVDRLISWLDEIQVGATSFARLVGIARVPPDRTATDDEPEGDDLRARDVRYAYIADRDVLHGIDLDLAPGERVAVVGPSGAGKSTLGRLLAGIHPPRVGRVEVGGVRLVDLPLDTLRKEVALVTQEQHVFVGTLAENLRLARPSASDEQLRQALAAVDALVWAEALPDGLETVVGAGGTRAHAGAGAAGRTRPARARGSAHARARRGDVAPRPARGAPPRAVARPRCSRAGRSSRSRTGSTRPTTPTESPSSRRVCSHEVGTHDELVERDGSYASLWDSWHGDR